MLRLIHLIRERDTEAIIYGDTWPGNIVVRQALQSIGFKPCGMKVTHYIWIPYVGQWALWAKWLQNEPQPSIPDLIRAPGSQIGEPSPK
jgi:hypothetical protein